MFLSLVFKKNGALCILYSSSDIEMLFFLLKWSTLLYLHLACDRLKLIRLIRNYAITQIGEILNLITIYASIVRCFELLKITKNIVSV